MLYKLLLIIILIFLPFSAAASLLYLEPAAGEYHQTDTFVVELRINTEGECINVVAAELSFPAETLKVIDFSKGDSILTLWVDEPEILQSAGKISFSGGIPAGFCGRVPGDPGESNLLAKLIFQVKEISFAQSSEIKFLSTSQVLLNDGLGTPDELSFEKAVFSFLPGVTAAPKKEWQEELEKDKTSPEAFEIELGQEAAIFDGKYFITFYTSDKQTGIDYYEIKEGDREWQKAVSPYLLEDQSLKGIIKVKAIDKAGNETIIEYIPLPAKKAFPYWIIGLVLIVVIWWFIRKIIR